MITFQVYVTTTATGFAQVPLFEHLVEVLADTATEASEIACQMAGCRADLVPGKDHLTPLSARVITDSTLDTF